MLDLLEGLAGLLRGLELLHLAVELLRNRWVQRALGTLLLLAGVPAGVEEPTLGGVIGGVGALLLAPDLVGRLRS